MIAQIFRSQLRQDILTLYFTHPESAFFLRELARKFDCSVGSLQRELNCLSKEGILVHENKGNVKLFRLNQEYPLLSEMTGILQKTVGVTLLLEDVVGSYEEIQCACVFGSYTKSAFYLLDPVEVLVIGDGFDEQDFASKFEMLESALKRPFAPKIISLAEFAEKYAAGDRTLKRIFKNNPIFVKGDASFLEQFTQQQQSSSITISEAAPIENPVEALKSEIISHESTDVVEESAMQVEETQPSDYVQQENTVSQEQASENVEYASSNIIDEEIAPENKALMAHFEQGIKNIIDESL